MILGIGQHLDSENWEFFRKRSEITLIPEDPKCHMVFWIRWGLRSSGYMWKSGSSQCLHEFYGPCIHSRIFLWPLSVYFTGREINFRAVKYTLSGHRNILEWIHGP